MLFLSLFRKSLASLLVCLLALQPACTPVRPDTLAQPGKGHLGKVGVAVARFDPQYHFDARTSGKGEGAAQGAVGGALACTRIGSGGGADALAMLLFIVCLPIGAAVGAAHGAATSESAPNIEKARARLNAWLPSHIGLGPLREALARYARETGIEIVLLPAGPAAPGDAPGYREFANDVDTVIEVSMLELAAVTPGQTTLPVSLQLKAKVRAVNTRDGRAIDSFPVRSTPILRPVSEWLANDAKLVQAGIVSELREVAETALDEVLLIYHPGKLVTNTEKDLVPAYALRVVSPPLRTTGFQANPTWGHLERFQLHTLTPAFEWEPFPRGYDVTIGKGAGQAGDVKYDLRIYADGEIFYERLGLAAPKHKLETPLGPCRDYRWTVRARFRLNGFVRVTEWTGAFNTLGGEAAPWWWRRGSKPALAMSPANVEYYPIIVTPGRDGLACTKAN